ncbi:hypothetical protein ACIGXA_15050 [Streptomyces fildesensis]|uniref:DUF1963 domain-containing protein n=1 Tax=Streptomyces fildesensis TaxID=375757 RepID=A0ABW8C8V9_9ACTN
MTRTTPERPVDVEALFPELSAHRRMGTRLHPRPGAPAPDQSSVGGPFLWPAGEDWPVCREPHPRGRGELLRDVRLRRRILAEAWSRPSASGEPEGPTDEEREVLKSLRRGRHAPELADTDPIPLLAVTQLFTRDVAGLHGPGDNDLLQVFWCPFDRHGDGQHPGLHLHWRDSAQVTEPLIEAPEPQVVGRGDYVPEPCVLHPEQVLEHEYEGLLPQGLQERLEEWEEGAEEDDEDEEGAGGPTYQHDLSIPPGWKVGGFASWHLTDPTPVECSCGRPMELLLTIDSKEWDGGSRSWVPIEDQPAIDVLDANIPTQISVGRWGSLRIFTCPADPTHPHRVSLQ